MNKYFLFFTFFLFAGNGRLSAQDYSVASIPDSLKTDAHCVIRELTVVYELLSVNSGKYRIRKAITLLDKEGESMADIMISYDKNSKVSIKEIVIYDSSGKKVKSIKQSEIEDIPAFGSSELFSENRLKYYDPENAIYPYTVAFEYEIFHENLISYGAWRPLSGYNISLQYASFTLTYPADVKINKKEVNFTAKTPALVSTATSEVWEVRNLKAIEEEPLDVSLSERIPSVYLMPDRLVYEKYYGGAGNWGEFGHWIYTLYEGRDQLSDAEKIKIDLLLKDIPDTLDRIKTLYKYMQERTRYVAVTLGIGGYQPFDSKSVFETGYGDCKALTNYMYSLLKYSGIRSFSALVAAGSYKVPIYKDFPNFMQFNHVILCVPVRKDTIWLECTSQKIPFGFLGDFTDDRDVLLIDKNGGKFAHTAKYGVSENSRSCRSEFTIDAQGTATCVTETRMKGLQYDNITSLLSSGTDNQKKWLYSNSTLPSLLIKDFSIKESRDTNPSATISESSVSKNYCSFSGSYMILPLNLINSQKPLQKMTRPRYSDIYISMSYIDYDTLVYKIPDNLKFESLPEGGTLNSDFGTYSWSVSGSGNEIMYTRKMIMKAGRYKPSEYTKLYEFILSVSKADKSKIILTKKI